MFLVIVVATGAVFLSHPPWLPLIGQYLVVADPLQPADAVVVLGGGERDRVEYGASLFRSAEARWFVVTNNTLDIPGIRDDYAGLMRREAIWQGVPEDRILTAPGMAHTTYDEALAVRQLARQHGWLAILVSTDPFHTRRSRLTFRGVFRDTGVTVIVRPVNESWYQADSWWLTVRGLRATGTEYLSLALYALGYR